MITDKDTVKGITVASKIASKSPPKGENSENPDSIKTISYAGSPKTLSFGESRVRSYSTNVSLIKNTSSFNCFFQRGKVKSRQGL